MCKRADKYLRAFSIISSMVICLFIISFSSEASFDKLINYFFLIKVSISSSCQMYLHKVEQRVSHNPYNCLCIYNCHDYFVCFYFLICLISLPNHRNILVSHRKELASGIRSGFFPSLFYFIGVCFSLYDSFLLIFKGLF